MASFGSVDGCEHVECSCKLIMLERGLYRLMSLAFSSTKIFHGSSRSMFHQLYSSIICYKLLILILSTYKYITSSHVISLIYIKKYV
jgi:hypothetical protein